MKSLEVCYWCTKIPQWGCMEHWLRYIKFYIQEAITPWAMCYKPRLVYNKPLGAPAYVRLIYCRSYILVTILRHYDVMTWKHFPHYWPFMMETTGHQSILLTKYQCNVLMLSSLLVWKSSWTNRSIDGNLWCDVMWYENNCSLAAGCIACSLTSLHRNKWVFHD